MKQPILTTERLTLRSFNRDDASLVQKLAGNFNLSKTTLNIPHPYVDGMAEVWIDSQKEAYEAQTGIVFAICLSGASALIGAISILDIDRDQGELGYWIGEPYWGNGYCTEAAGALIQYSFNKLGLKRVYAEHLSRNPASGNVLEKIGMDHIGSKPKRDRYNEIAVMELYEICNISEKHK